MRNTKIVATLGPSSSSMEALRSLLVAGVDVFRLNASHGTHEAHAGCIERLREVSAQRGAPVAILLDLQGPKIRLGCFEHGKATLVEGAIFTITTIETLGNAARASTTYSDFAKDVKPGDVVLLDDGALELKVIQSDGIEVRCQVVTGGEISDHKGINLPGVQISSPSVTPKDVEDLDFGLAHNVDFVALSFVRQASDVKRLRQLLAERNARVPVISKIEKPEGWKNLDAILAESDGVMVARGDLGVEMALEKVPFIQKSTIERARQAGKVVITATQMLESMVEHPSPTRAEVSDVANAIYDGTDAIMLSAETSVGKYPVEAVRMMARIATETEAVRGFRAREIPVQENPNYAEIVAAAAYLAARSAGVEAIVVFTNSGASARLVSRLRPPVTIFAFTPDETTAKRMALCYGVHPVLAPDVASTDEMLAQVDRMLLERGWLIAGDGVVFVAGQPVGRPGTTNLLKLHRLGEAHPTT